MYKVNSIKNFDIHSIKEDKFWNFGENKELLMHRIHAYPAKFPHFLIEKALNYVKEKGAKPKLIADVFCGCGTTALEAKRLGIDFWGCDINPVATLIAKVKSETFDDKKVKDFQSEILILFDNVSLENNHLKENERINYWFKEETINDLNKLLFSIKATVKSKKYQDFFLCAFSNILKASSRWLTKSIKPQTDPNKKPAKVKSSFEKQVRLMLKANLEAKDTSATKSKSRVITTNLLSYKVQESFVDLLITSPPYVTSYEYADLHQLSTLCLGHVDDYRKLRNGTIGSVRNYEIKQDELEKLDALGLSIYQRLSMVDKSKAKSVAKYFLDLDKATEKIYKMVNATGYALFVIGNTNFKGVEIDNASYLIRRMESSGFKNIEVTKRKISGKNLTPYRDKTGKFANSNKGRKVYSHEYLVIGRK